MAEGVYTTLREGLPIPVIPGPAGAARPATKGQPGHLERLMGDAPSGSWPLAERWRARGMDRSRPLG